MLRYFWNLWRLTRDETRRKGRRASFIPLKNRRRIINWTVLPTRVKRKTRSNLESENDFVICCNTIQLSAYIRISKRSPHVNTCSRYILIHVSPILSPSTFRKMMARACCNIAESLASGMHFKRPCCQLEGKKNAWNARKEGEGGSKSGVPRCNRRKYGRRVKYARDASNASITIWGGGQRRFYWNV